jgi:hypothetical protein
MSSLEEEFEARVRSSLAECHRLGYHATDFERMLETSTAKSLAERFVTSGEIQSGLKRVAALGRPDLAIESIMLEPAFEGLFKPELRAAARWRLDQAKAN